MSQPEDKNKSYFLITAMSEAFRKWAKTQEQTGEHTIQEWEAMFQLAIAQQLSVIASHLGKIVEAIEAEQNKGKSE